ncbi:MAG: hypothetical protein HY744_16180 [Deltaproteobacteria bacterium]|nr:hypothetical protein [Deltaproteobacteria bacterium]
MHVVRVALHDASATSFCTVVLMRQGARAVPLENAATVVAKIAKQAARLRPRLSARLHEEDYQWALLGAVLTPGQEATIPGLHLEPRTHMVLAVGDDSSLDVDLLLHDRSGQALASDRRTDRPALLRRLTAGPGHELTIRNVSSDGPSLVAAVVLDVLPPGGSTSIEPARLAAK